MKVNPLIELPLLAAMWGGSFIFMRIGSPEFGPVLFMAVRTLVASLFLLPILLMKKQTAHLTRNYRHLFIVGMLNTGVPFVMFGWATLTLSAGLTSVLNATTPMFGAIVAFIWLKDKMNLSAIMGLMIGFVGVYCLMLDKISATSGAVLLPTMAVLVATLCYGISANYTKKYLHNVKPLALATGSQCAATIVLVPLSLFFIPKELPSNIAIGSAIFLGIVCTGVAYILFFRLINALGPTKAISVTYLIPAFGIGWGALFLNEQVTQSMVIGGGLILIGVALTTGVIKIPRRKLT